MKFLAAGLWSAITVQVAALHLTIPKDTNADSSLFKKQTSSYWYENIEHKGISAFGPSNYTVYRNVKDYGATGNGVTDDSAAINAAINAGNRCGKGCSSSTTTPAVIYFPSGTYLISTSIVDQYYTQLIGNPLNPPTIKATSKFSGNGLIDGDKYYTSNLNWGATNVFYRQVRNFILDMTAVPATSKITGIHWPTAQATSLQNIVFQMSTAPGVKHVGIFCEQGSAGFVTDLTFNGGFIGINAGNQQYTMRNLVFNNCVTAISQIWNWSWLYQGISINNCQTGIDMSGGNKNPTVGSITLIDSSFTNTPVGIVTFYNAIGGNLILENVDVQNVTATIKNKNGTTILAGHHGLSTIAGWGEGRKYTPSGFRTFQGYFTPTARPPSLINGGKYYVRSKPQYETLPLSSFSSVRTAGATGNGITDDTVALQSIINSATAIGNVVFFDAGTYLITSTLTIPPGAKLIGESYSVIMSSGSFFNDMTNPQPVIQVGTAGQVGQVEWSDMIVSTQGAQAGAILIQWNLNTSGTPSGMWDVHTRIGGFAGSKLQIPECSKNPDITAINTACIAAYMSVHITSSASGLYMENVWLWLSDHDIEDPAHTQLTIYAGRGLLIESKIGTFWLVGTSVEHHVFYQYQLANTQNLFLGFIQTETPYYQPNPPAPAPFTPVATLNDPTFSDCTGGDLNCYDAWGLRIVNSKNVSIYGAGHYSFFNNYNGTCPAANGPENCQTDIVDLDSSSANILIYNLATIGSISMISTGATIAKPRKSLASYKDNVSVFPDIIAIFQVAGNKDSKIAN